jgi:hypothetical protein
MPFFVPDGTNLLGTTADTMMLDTDWEPIDYYFYKLIAVDRHGNRSPESLLQPEDIKVPTFLAQHTASYVNGGIEVSWVLSEPPGTARFSVLRKRGNREGFDELPNAEVTREDLVFYFRDESVEPGNTYRYRIDVLDNGNRSVLFETDEISTPAMPLTLFQNHPNPFNPATTISFYLPEKCTIKLEVFDITGKRVVSLVDDKRGAGLHSLRWDGVDEKGTKVSTGVYLYRLTAGKKMISRKMVLAR